MNEKLNLVEILKDCPEGTKLYSPMFGDVELVGVHLDKDGDYPIEVRLSNNALDSFTKDGRILAEYNGECTLFPSKYQRDWSKFTAPWYNIEKQGEQILSQTNPKKDRFDPKTLKPFDKVLIRDSKYEEWRCDMFSHIHNRGDYHFRTITADYAYCIPYNDDTKHLVGTNEEAPEFYRYWEE